MSKYKIQTENGIQFIELDKELDKGDKGFILQDKVAKIEGEATLFKVLDKGDKIEKDDVDETYEIDAIEKNEEEQFILGRVMIPGKIDADGEVINKEETEKAAHRFLRNSHTIGLVHKHYSPDTYLVENYIAPVDFEKNGKEISAGTWIAGVKIENDEIWKAIKEEKLKAFSVGGWANKVPLNEEE